MNYKIDNTPLSFFDAVATPKKRGCLSLEGFMDLPKRIGKTEHNWGTSIEPFVSKEDIVLDGRTLSLNIAVPKENLEALKSACLNCKTLYSDVAQFGVVCKDVIKVEEVGIYNIVSVKFWEQEVVLPSISITSFNAGSFQIDGYNLSDLGVVVSKSSNLKDLPKRIEIPTTQPYTKTGYRDTNTIEIECYIKGVSATNIYNITQQLNAILISPGLHLLKYRGTDLTLYFKDGIRYEFVARNIVKTRLKAVAVVE